MHFAILSPPFAPDQHHGGLLESQIAQSFRPAGLPGLLFIGGFQMQQITCPLDGTPCASDCPDRFYDREEGGCLLTMQLERGASIMVADVRKHELVCLTPDGGRKVAHIP